jgi:phage virion morphogenesis protein
MGDLAVDMQLDGLEQATQAIERLAGWDRFELMDVIGRLVQLQTRQRIAVEKQGPDGQAWQKNRKGSSTLYASGALHDSIDYRTGLGQIIVGSPLIYAAIHHFGGIIKPKKGKVLSFMAGNSRVFAKSVTMPARPYLGISSDNAREIEEVVGDFMQEVLK